ncbi:putative porin [Flavobacterium urocaniciphilum]|uniref:Putative porin n=1 Tax=Flavobacterium urocaniciphilum TaxID=1299341 RepID=A0A1H9AVV5_9FLAO|nr:putative porin [Flavobacterium urocaniciphilum]SEP80942.1 Putative porin [Flavobacterium urocaniciphilum]
MRKLLVVLFLLPILSFAQEKDTTLVKELKAEIKLYKTFNLEKDSIAIDTSLTIQDEYKYNYLRKDNFGLFSFANEAYLYNQLDFSKKNSFLLPQFGFNAKHITYLNNNDIYYYSVPTPLTDLYFKTVMRQGQSLDALLSVNTKPNLNFTVAYKSIRSIGDYFNNLTSSGHFRFITSYHSPNKKYYLHANFVGQDILNQENGGIVDPTQLDGTNTSFDQRERVDIYFNDAYSKLKGNRYFLDHSYQFNSGNSLVLKHQMYYENKFFEFIQLTKSDRLGEALYNSVNNKTNYDVFYNKAGLSFKTKNLGEVSFFIDNYSYNQFYRIPLETTYVSSIPYNFHNRINTIGGQYDFDHRKWNFHILMQNAISNKPTSNYEAFAKYKFDENQYVKISAQQLSKLPDNTFVYNQSDYANYNWLNSFKNEKQSILKVETKNKWFEAFVQLSNLSDHLFFYNTEEKIDSLVVKPFQYEKDIQYFAAEIAKEVKYKNWALDNRVKFQQVEQSDNVLNVPQFITRNTLYYTKAVFKKAMLLQTGVTLNYFSKYFADDYVPVIGEFYTQNITKVGDFPVFDFFVNARVRQTRIYLKAEHVNALFASKVNYYNTPNYPFRDFHIRFGLEWNFFK